MEETKGLRWIHGVLAFSLAMLVLLFGGYVLIPLFGKVGAFLAGAVIALIGVVFTMLTKTKWSAVLPHEMPPIRRFFGGVFFYISIVMLNGIYSVLTSSFLQGDARQDMVSSIVTALPPAASILLVAVLPALCEEFFCRGFLMHCFRGVKKDWLVILITACCFGVMHLDVYTFVPSAMIGALFGYLALRTHSLVIPILLHFINNAFSVVLSYLSAEEASEEASSSLLMQNVGQKAGMILFYFGIGLLCFCLGYRLFHGKKLFIKRGVGIVILCFLLTCGGCGIMTASSIEIVYNETQTVSYRDAMEVTIPLSLEAGNYSFVVTASAEDPIEIVVISAEDPEGKPLAITAIQSRPQMNEMLTL